MHLVYIIWSESAQRHYCGECQDLDDRLERHNGDRSLSTKGKGPWTLVKTFECENRSLAKKLERKIKSRGISRFLLDQDK